MTLNKRAARSIKNNIAFYLISTLLTILVSVFIISAVSTGRTLTSILNNFMEEYVAEDAEFTTYTPISDADIESLEDEYNVLIEQGMYKDATEGDVTYRVFRMPEKINLFDVRDGSMPDAGEALITQRYADGHDIKVGDVVKAGDYSYKISAFTTKADYMYMTEKTAGNYRDNETFALLIVNDEDYDKVDADEVSYYSIVYNEDNDLDVRERLNDDYMVSSYVAATSNMRLSMPINQGDEVTNMALILGPVIFIIVIALIVMVLGRHIKNEKALLGTFEALGYSKGKIIRHYMRFALIPGVIGSVAGCLLAIPTIKMFAWLYIEYDFEYLEYHMKWDVPACLVALLLPSILYCLTTACEAAKLLRQSPVELLRGTGKDSRTVGIMKNGNTKTKAKLRVRSVLGHPGRSLVTVFGVCIASICVMVGFMMRDSMEDLIDGGLTDSTGYKYLYALNYLGDGDAEDGEAVLRGGYEVDGAIVQMALLGVSDESEYFPTETQDDQQMDYDKYYITSAGATTYGVSVGDDFTFRNIIDLTEYTVKIDGIVTDNTKCAVYTSRANAADIMGVPDGSYNCIASDEKLDIDMSTVASMTEVTDSTETMKELMGLMYGVIAVIVILGMLLGIFILYLVINMIVSESRGNISVMRVLGFSVGEISSRVLNVNSVLVVLGFLLSIPCSYEIVKIGYADTIENFGMLFEPIITVGTLVLTFVIVCVVYEAALLLQRRKIAKIDMVEALKEANAGE